MRPDHAEIVGGGFGGLVAATALAERGWSVRVHERRAAIDAEGYGIAVQPNMMLIFKALGIAAEVIAGGARIDRRDSLDGGGDRKHIGALDRRPDDATAPSARAGPMGAGVSQPAAAETGDLRLVHRAVPRIPPIRDRTPNPARP